MGYYVHDSQSFTKTIVPLIDSFQNGTILLAHGDSVGQPPQPPAPSQLNYNASFVILTDDYTLRQVQLDQPAAVGEVDYGIGSGQENVSITVPNNDRNINCNLQEHCRPIWDCFDALGVGFHVFSLNVRQ